MRLLTLVHVVWTVVGGLAVAVLIAMSKVMRSLCLCTAGLALAIGGPLAAGTFEDLGVPLKKAGFTNACVGPDATGSKDLIYANYNQEAGPLLLVAIDPQTGQTHQYHAEAKYHGANGRCCGPDGKIYLGTWETGALLVFDPKHPEKNIQTIGKPIASETYILNLVAGIDSRIWGVTYPNAKLFSYDTATGESKDHGRSSSTEHYSEFVAVGPDGRVYTTFGYRAADLMLYDPNAGQRRSISPPELQGRITKATVSKAKDGRIYSTLTLAATPPNKPERRTFKVEGDKLTPWDRAKIPWFEWRFRDGRYLEECSDGSYGIFDPKTRKWQRGTFSYQGAGKAIFMVGLGPDGCIYGSGAMPIDIFRYCPRSEKLEFLGSIGGGDVYSMILYAGRLYCFCYSPPDAMVYSPQNPWRFGKGADNNPRDLGPLGDGHCRPQGAVVGPDDLFYIGSLAPYGELGGAMAIFDPRQQSVVANFRHLVHNQSLLSLAWEKRSNLIFGGSSILGGGGSDPSENEARLFAFDPVRRQKLYEVTPLPGVQGIKVIAAAEGKIFGVSGRKTFVFDPQTKSVVRTMENPFGSQLWGSFRTHDDGLIWGLTKTAIFTLDPKTCEYRLVAKSERPITAGFALTDRAIYFASSANLWRYRW